MKTSSRKSTGLGGFLDASCSLALGTRKHLRYNRFYLFIILLIFTMVQSSYCCSCFSIILNLQRSNEMYKDIKRPYTRVQNIPAKNVQFSHNFFLLLMIIAIAYWIYILILLSGDVEVNPGPDSAEGNTNSSFSSANSLPFEMLSNHLSILHLNIQSILPKLDLIKAEADAYDILVFSESWLKPEVKNDIVSLENFLPPFRTDRCDRAGGGVIVYVRDNFLCKRRTDLELPGLEAVWIEIHVKTRPILIGGFYRPP